MSETYRVRLQKECHVFSACHFITYNGSVCEPLHGHNYCLAVEAEGPLDDNQYVVDFIALRDALRAITEQLDHHVLLPTDHPLIRIRTSEREVEATFEDRHWVFPRSECALLPVSNTTAELLARYIGRQLREEVARRTGVRLARLEVAVGEDEGQWGVCELTCD
jgi:6-pyruvoyltetrahydropterin/6-carboxytetrahydropterin synthase